MNDRPSEEGTALVTVLLLVAMLSAMLAAYTFLTRMELATTKSSMDATRGFYAAEAGLNERAEGIRQVFLGYNRPSGVTPAVAAGQIPCLTGDQGSGDFACSALFLDQHDVMTYVREDPGNPSIAVIPPGEPYQDLSAQEYTYFVNSVAKNSRDDRPEAILEMHFRSRLVPLFQFATFYNKDLEILPGPAMLFEGPVHTNGDLYVGAAETLTVNGQVTTVGELYHGRKEVDGCSAGGVAVYDPVNPSPLPACAGGRRQVTAAEAAPWNGMIRIGVDPVTVPPPESLDPVPGQIYWDLADLRVMLDLDAGGAIEVRDASGNLMAVPLCGAVGSSGSFLNRREAKTIQLLEVDIRALMDCAHDNPALMGGRPLDDSTEGGLVWYFGVEGPSPIGVPNDYGVRIGNGGTLGAVDATAPAVRGLTIVTNQAVYVQGDFNAVNWVPAAFLADSLNVLSNGWQDAWNDPAVALDTRVAASTQVFAAFLAGTDSTGDAEGVAGQSAGDYNGGLENYPRFHEQWTGQTLTYRGSFVSLGTPRHVVGAWSTGGVYSPPIRDWGYDVRFNNAANLPPLSPRFVYLRQDLLVRDFDL